MMALNPGGSGDPSATAVPSSSHLSSSPSSVSSASRGMLAKPLPLTRRRRSKGTIAGFASISKEGVAPGEAGSGNSESTGGIDNASSNNPGKNHQPQHVVADAPTVPVKPDCAGRLSLLCSQNAIRMGARTQLGLCPPGRSRRSLQSALRTRSRGSSTSSRRALSTRTGSSLHSKGEPELGGYYGLEKMLGSKQLEDYDDQEEDYLLSTDTFDVDSDEEASSADEDELSNIDDLLSEDGAPALDDEKKYLNLREPVFTQSGTDPSVSNPNGAPMTTANSGKLPFNYRKIRYFDSVTASDRMAARTYLREETRKCKTRDGIMLAKHLRRMQRRERRRIQLEKGENPELENSDEENDDPKEQALLKGGVSEFPHPMTSSISAALVLESLSLNPLESVEGMAKCYDGIVAAGVALLDSQVDMTASASRSLNEEEKARASRSEIMAALAPLLITSLELASGEVILSLARLRRMCGTPRYQRRFVQRVAPCLIRPPRGAIWCLKHQNDMEPILAAAELIFDSSFDVFRKGWYERGRLLLADSKRAETLNTAAEQLRNLSAAEPDSLMLRLGHGHGRHTGKLMVGAAPTKDGSAGGTVNEPLAEWEVMAVDVQIRISIANIIKMDWSRVSIQTRAAEFASRNRHVTTTGTPRSLGASRPGVPQLATGEVSPKSVQPPKSPVPRPSGTKSPVSPPSMATQQVVAPSSLPAESIESVFGPSFSTQPPSAVVAAPSSSPDDSDGQPPSLAPLSPPVPRRPGFEDAPETQSPFTSPPQTPKQYPVAAGSLLMDSQTPPRSPLASSNRGKTSQTPPLALVSPKSQSPKSDIGANRDAMVRSPTNQGQILVERVERAVSPSASIGSTTSEIVPYRPVSSTSSVGGGSTTSGTSQTAHYRMLTSTASERKRTVAACRALRAQISRFEEAFIQLHGRPPKGATERAPLATTYAQYREWKRAIRADAACRIQALFRGARTRMVLLRSNNPRMAHVVMTRAGRSGFDMLRQLSIPVEIGVKDPDRGVGLAIRESSLPDRHSYSDTNGVEVFISPSQGGIAPSQAGGPAPIWRGEISSRRSGHGSPAAQQFPSPSNLSTSSASASISSEFNNMTLAELQAKKRDLKQQLKQYDMMFARKHGRMPVKAEKEPIRHKYEHYNALKTQINMMEREPTQARTTPGLQSGGVIAQRSPSPPAGMMTGPDSAGESSPEPSGRVRARKKVPKSQQQPFEPPLPSTSTPSGAPSQDLSVLKAEKGKLHQMLRSYEKDFFKEHKRQVSSFADIKPVASQYRRYKEIKKAIAALQQSGEK